MLDNLSEEYIKKFQSLKGIIEELQKTITEHSDYLSAKETRTRQFLIDPLLRELGWDVLNPSAVQLEFGVKEGKGTKQMDYALMLDDCPIAIIQAKQLNYKYNSLAWEARRTKNILNRAKLTNIHYIIVTDGNRWNIYEVGECLRIMGFELCDELSEAIALRVMEIWKWKLNLASSSSMEGITPEESEDDDELSPREQLWRKYWTALKNRLEQCDSVIKTPPTAPRCHYMSYGIKGQGIHLVSSASKKHLRVILRTTNDRAVKDRFQELKAKRRLIDKEIRDKCEWQENPKTNQICVYLHNTNFERRQDWDWQHQWFCEKLETFYRAFAPRFEALLDSEQQGQRGNWGLDYHRHLTGEIMDIFQQLRRRILNLDTSISEKINRHYIAYKLNTNFVGIVPQARRLLLHLKLPFPDLTDSRGLCRDVTNIGTYFAGNVEVGISSVDQLDYIMSLIDQAFDRQR